MLGAEESLDIRRIKPVLIGRREKVLDPLDPVGSSQIVAKARIPGIHALLGQRVGDLPPRSRVALLRLMRLPDLLLVDLTGGGDEIVAPETQRRNPTAAPATMSPNPRRSRVLDRRCSRHHPCNS